MFIESISIREFRAIAALSVDLNRLTILLGANSAGKSTIIRALAWFFDSAGCELEDVREANPDADVSVRVTFTDFTDADRGAFPGYTTGDRMPLIKTRRRDGSVKLTGRGLVYQPFTAIRSQSGAVAVRTSFNEFCDAHPELGLSRVRSQTEALSRMEAFEFDNPRLCEEDERDATHLLGAVGQGTLGQRFRFVYVPAQRDAELDAREGRDSALSRLLLAIAEQRATAGQRVSDFESEMRSQYDEIVAGAHGASLDDLSAAMTADLQSLVSTGEVRLEVQPATWSLPDPKVVLRAGEGGSLTDISRLSTVVRNECAALPE